MNDKLIKTKEEIDVLVEGGKIISGILDRVVSEAKVGVETESLENLVLNLIRESGGGPAFKNYPMGGGIFFPSALCVSINDEVVHGASLPNRVLKSGDIVSFDLGLEWPLQSKEEALRNNRPYNHQSKGGGFYTDTCRTVAIGKVSKEARKIIQASKEALYLGIDKAKAGNTINDIARAVESFVLKNGYSVVKDLVGHGLGYKAHEYPHVFNYAIGDDDIDNITLKAGMIIAIEPMINAGSHRVRTTNNHYTFVSADHSLSSHYEHSIAILENSNIILTKSKYD